MTAELETLASAHGVSTTYVDSGSVERRADPDAVVAVLAALGVPIDHPDQAGQLLAASPPVRPLIEPVVVVDAETATSVPVAPGVRSWSLDLEDGGVLAGRDPGPTIELGALPVGVHTLRVEAGAAEGSGTVLAAPRRAHRNPALRRSWGVFAPLHAIRHDGRIGDIHDIVDLADRIAPDGGRVVAVLPILSTFLGHGAEPFEYSPYQPVSRTFWNEAHLSPALLPVPVADLPAVPPDAHGHVDHAAAGRRGRAIVDGTRRALAAHPRLRDELRQFRDDCPGVDRYAAFRAAVELHGPSPRRLDADSEAVEHHVVAQWLCDRQLREVNHSLRGRDQAVALDLPVGCHPDGFDIHADPEGFLPVSVGAPPDDFFQGGQNWGFPPLHPRRSRATGHRAFIDAVDTLARHAGVVRIDHILGLRRLWCIPPGAEATDGVYVRYPLDELLAAARIVSHRHRSVLIGENLGTVPPSVTAAMAESGLAGMHEEQFVVGDAPGNDPLPRVPAGSVAGVNTHDMATFTGFWRGADLRDHVALGLRDADGLDDALDERQRSIERYRAAASNELDRDVGPDRDDVYVAAVERLACSDADQVMVTLEDLWAEPDPQNVPGTHRERPNWIRRMRLDLDDGFATPLAGRVLGMLGRHRSAASTPSASSTSASETDDDDERAS